MNNLGASTKRRFLGLVYFPYGGDVAANMGLAGMSPEVEFMEQRAAQNNYSAMMSDARARERLEAVLKLADWYDEAAKCVSDAGIPGDARTTQEHLVNFFMAADYLIRLEQSHV